MVIRDKAVLAALVSIVPSYPVVSPVFCLSLQLGSNTETLETSKMLRDLEKEVNLGWKEQLGEMEGGLLMATLHSLLTYRQLL